MNNDGLCLIVQSLGLFAFVFALAIIVDIRTDAGATDPATYILRAGERLAARSDSLLHMTAPVAVSYVGQLASTEDTAIYTWQPAGPASGYPCGWVKKRPGCRCYVGHAVTMGMLERRSALEEGIETVCGGR